MEIRVLKYFLAFAREQNISVAANYLHVTQPTLSRQIIDMVTKTEEEFSDMGSNIIGDIYIGAAES